MTVCPKCKKQELEGVEEICPLCTNKKHRSIAKDMFIGLAVFALAVVTFPIWKGKDGGTT